MISGTVRSCRRLLVSMTRCWSSPSISTATLKAMTNRPASKPKARPAWIPRGRALTSGMTTNGASTDPERQEAGIDPVIGAVALDALERHVDLLLQVRTARRNTEGNVAAQFRRTQHGRSQAKAAEGLGFPHVQRNDHRHQGGLGLAADQGARDRKS